MCNLQRSTRHYQSHDDQLIQLLLDNKEKKNMYKCQITGKFSRQGHPHGPKDENGHATSIPGEKLNKIVIETRERIYTKRVRNEETGEWEKVEIGRGWEVVREINASDEGLALWDSWTEEQRAVFVRAFKENEKRAA